MGLSWLVMLTCSAVALYAACWIIACLEIPVDARIMSPPHALNTSLQDFRNARIATTRSGQSYLYLHLMDRVSHTRKEQVALFEQLDALDVLGLYEPVAEKNKPDSIAYYRNVEARDVLLWYYPGRNAWYVGPEDRRFTDYGILQAGGSMSGPPRDRGWEIYKPNHGWTNVDLNALNAAEIANVLNGGAKTVSAPMIGADSEIILGEFHYDGSLISGRPRYVQSQNAGESSAYGLWWHQVLECWCIGPMLEAERLGLDLDSLRSWSFCLIRARDPALLPEWVSQPWYVLDSRWWRHGGNAKMRQGQLLVGREVISFTPSHERCHQIPGTGILSRRVALALRCMAILSACMSCLCNGALRRLIGKIWAWARKESQPEDERINPEGAQQGRNRRDATRRRRQVGRGGNGRQQGQPIGKSLVPKHTSITMANDPFWWDDLRDFHAELETQATKERQDFICMVTGEIMRNPTMLCKNGVATHTYEHNAIAEWINTGNCSDPVTREYVSEPTLIVNQDKQREIRSWCEAKVKDWQQQLETLPSLPAPVVSQSVHVFVDHSNIFVGAQKAGRRLDIAELVEFVESGRDIKERVLIGSYHSELARMDWERLGYKVAADPRRGKEHFVDDALHAQLMHTACKIFSPVRTLVVLTGDGNRNEGRTTFPKCIEMALKTGWHVELCSWRSSLHSVYRSFSTEYCSHFQIRELDNMPS